MTLNCIKDRGQYRQFVANRIHKIWRHENVLGHHVPFGQNPAEVGSRRAKINKSKLGDPTQWLADGALEVARKSQAGTDVVKEIFKAAIVKDDSLASLLKKYSLSKVLQILAFVRPFICINSLSKRKSSDKQSQSSKTTNAVGTACQRSS